MQEASIDTARLTAMVHTSSLFRVLSPADVAVFLDEARVLAFRPDEVIIDPEGPCDEMYVILEGTAAVNSVHDGNRTYLAALGEGQLVGEAGLFTNAHRTAEVRAQDHVQAVRIDRTGFIRALKSKPNAGVRLLFVMIHGLLSKLRAANLELAFERAGDIQQGAIDDIVAELTAASSSAASILDDEDS